MDDDDLMDVYLTDLDLNQEPTDPPLHRVARYGSLLNELETAHDRIEERIRQLEAVTARARQRQRWRQSRNSMEISYSPGEMMVGVGLRSVLENNNNTGIVERTPERGKGCKRDSSHLIAKALEMDSEVKKADKEGGSFYDCNICLDLAREPVLTCCGHLFCWPCFYQVSNIDSTSKECPVCKGEVSDSTVIPIYGNGDNEVCETESGLQIPPRPKAQRVESVRQQRDARKGEMLSQRGHRIRIHQVSRVLSESAASLSSLSSALSNAERLVEDLETVINNRVIRGEPQVLPVDVGNTFPRPSVVVQSNNQPPESSDISLPVAPSSSIRRRSIMSRNLDLDSRDSREPRRRRLN
ncbi:hypothetical protein DH2020_023468 [Rehmannia glutinosa]|uniref:E3 ubiquitin-protein ligase RMA n=1 Tax=Rehmannia glutinosa TaxID=99300 RepID=A0ABR0W7L0_REHGL